MAKRSIIAIKLNYTDRGVKSGKMMEKKCKMGGYVAET